MGLDLSKYRDIYNTKVAGKKDDKYVNLAKGECEVKIRILAPKNADDLFYQEFANHYFEGSTYVCPKISFNLACPMCEFSNALFKTNKESDRDLAFKVRAKKKYYFNCVVRGEEDKGVRIFSCGVKMYKFIMEALINEEIGDFTDPAKGFDLIVKKRIQGEFPNYDLTDFSRKATRLSDDPAQIKKWYDERYNLADEVNTPMSYDDLKKVMVGEIATNDSIIDEVKGATKTDDATDTATDDVILATDDNSETDIIIEDETKVETPKTEAKVEVKKEEAKVESDDDFDSQLQDLLS